jgi:hypothetical protein
MRLDISNVKSRFVDRTVVTSWTGPRGLYVLIPDYEGLTSLVAEALAPPRAQPQPGWRVEVMNGSPREDWGLVAAERLRWEGFQVVQVGRLEAGEPRTQIVDLTTDADPGSGTALYRLTRLYRRGREDVVPRPTEPRDVDFQVVLGRDYDPCAAVRSP